MRGKGGRNNRSLNVSRGNLANKNRTENMLNKKKLKGGHGRYFSKKIDEVEDDGQNKLIDPNYNTGKVRPESDIEVDRHQDDGSDNTSGAGSSSDEESGTDDSGNKDVDGIKGNGGVTRNSTSKSDDVDESESDDDDNESDDSGTGSEEDEDDEESMENSEDEARNDANDSKTVVPSSKQKKLNKQRNGSSVAKKEATVVQRLSKFQGTSEASGQSQLLEQTHSPTKKRKKPNEDEIESEISPAKKQHVLDVVTESSVDKRKEERNARSLFLKDLPSNTTVEMVKKLSPEIINVRIPLDGKKNVQNLYAFIEFENEEAAERNYKRIMEKTIENKKITVDYCGEKSSHKKAPKDYPVNMRRLFIPGLPMDVTADELKQHFPEARSLSSKQRGSKRFVFLSFEDEMKAKKAFEENDKLTIRGMKITVLYAYKKDRPRAHVMQPRKWGAKIIPSIFEDEDNTDATKGEAKGGSNKNLNESTEVTKEGKKKRQKKKNIKTNKEPTKMETDENEELEIPTETAKVRKKNFKKKNKNKKVG